MTIKVTPLANASLRVERGRLVVEGWDFQMTDIDYGVDDLPAATLDYLKQKAVLDWISSMYKPAKTPVHFLRNFICFNSE